MKVGDKVRKARIFSGSDKSGEAVGPVLIVLEVANQRCVDGVEGKDTIIILSDGTWEFVWNLIPQERGEQNEGE